MGIMPELFSHAIDTDGIHADVLMPELVAKMPKEETGVDADSDENE